MTPSLRSWIRLAFLTLAAAALAPPIAPAGVSPRTVLGRPIEYVIVTEDSLAAAFVPLADWKTHSGIAAVGEPLSEIRASYPAAADEAERIRLFLRDAHGTWGARWALLGGDSSVVRSRLATTTFFGGASIPTDLYFAALDGSWDANGNGRWGEGAISSSDPGDDADLTPELYVGRSPVHSRAEVAAFVARTLQDEVTPAADRDDRALGAAAVLFPGNWSGGPLTLDGAQLVEEVLPEFDLAPAVRVARLYQNDLEPSYRPGAIHETRAAVLDSLSAGQNLVLLVGLGTDSTVSVGGGSIGLADIQALANAAHPFHLYSIGASLASFGPASLGRAALLASGGASSVIGADLIDFPTATRAYEREFLRLLFEQNVRAVGELHARSRLPFVPFSAFDGVNRWTQMDLTLLGDPEMRLRLRPACSLEVVAPPSLAFGDTAFEVAVSVLGAPLAGARVTAYRPGRQLSISFTGPDGVAHVPYVAEGRDTLDLTVTADDCRPHQERIPRLDLPTPTLADLVEVAFDGDAVRLTWSVTGRPGAGATLDRHAFGEAPRALANGATDGVGRVEFEDRDVRPGDRLAYSLGVATASGEARTAETWVEVPRLRLALEAPSPNPGPGRFDLTFELPHAGFARLEVMDVAGRIRAARKMEADAGVHHVRFDLGSSSGPGIYFARLTASGRNVTRRFVVVR
ncbi:MAG: T9SS type A sorting domain-containing protein [Candidatus Eisenbacteria bacterium]|nr:T9SS type A sorting domain-containing protein [Candidatus Eisenbacteria bacterium]